MAVESFARGYARGDFIHLCRVVGGAALPRTWRDRKHRGDALSSSIRNSETQNIFCATQGRGRRGAAACAAGPQGQGEGKAWQGAEQRQPLEERGGDGAQVCLFTHQPPPISLCRWMSRQVSGRRLLRNVCCCRKAPLPSLQTVCNDMFIRAGSSTIHDAGSSMTAISRAQTKGAVQLWGGICLRLHGFAEDFCTLAHASVYCCKKRKVCRYTGSETNAGHSCHLERTVSEKKERIFSRSTIHTMFIWNCTFWCTAVLGSRASQMSGLCVLHPHQEHVLTCGIQGYTEPLCWNATKERDRFRNGMRLARRQGRWC